MCGLHADHVVSVISSRGESIAGWKALSKAFTSKIIKRLLAMEGVIGTSLVANEDHVMCRVGLCFIV